MASYFKMIISVVGVKLNNYFHKYCGNLNGYNMFKRYLVIYIRTTKNAYIF